MKTKTAGDLMIPLDKYPHMPYWFTIREAIAILYHAELDMDGKKSLARAVLVFDEEYKFLGMVRRRDILMGFEPKSFFQGGTQHSKKLFDTEPDPNLLEFNYDKLQNIVQEKAELPVSEVMIPVQNTVNYDDHIMKIIYELSTYQHAMVAVIKDGVVVGVVRTVELLNEISKILEIE